MTACERPARKHLLTDRLIGSLMPLSHARWQRLSFYRAKHFSAKRGIAIACRLSVRPSVCLSVCL